MKISISIAVACLGLGPLRAEEAVRPGPKAASLPSVSTAPAAAQGELSDSQLEDMKARTKEALDRKVVEIEKSHTERQLFATKMTQDRIAFEKRMATELQLFLTTLKEAAPATRRTALTAFSDKQRADREQFTYESRQKVEEFRRRGTE
jgi:hypothetical protein